jgi:DNA repair exonuclease SbcCD ATPase subunit
MIIFKSISWKNFLSTGNSPNKVLLNKSPTTLVIGKNGEGKSTILDALCFSLFGKPFRNINKGQLVNSINQKGCVVEIEFEISGREYKIIRGIKPNIFEIYLNGEMINQDAASRDYQKVLEQQILKLNYKTFTQVVILGSASFVPFMQLSSLQRREVIEDILDIRIFSTMNTLLKEKINETKDEIAKAEAETILSNLNQKLSTITEIQSKITDKNIELSTRNSTVTLLNKQVKEMQAEVESTKTDTTNIDEEKRKLKDLAKSAMEKITTKTTLQEQRNLEEVASILLKDTGIKTAIIREYLPAMNKLINKYLQAMDAYIHFELDESFNEIVKSRHRDDFTYASFSEGEKMRIDLSILFTWRQIAKMKNSVNTNLLLLDEIFDSSLDTAGTDYFLNLMNQFGENTNIFVISHKGDQLFEKFRSVIKFEKRNDFSLIATP